MRLRASSAAARNAATCSLKALSSSAPKSSLMTDAFAAPLHCTFSTEDALNAFAAEFSTRLGPGSVVALSGPLGAGKTTFVRAIVRALHGADETSSPTFTFWHRYAGPHPAMTPIDHLDLFRIENPRELDELGLEEAFAGDSIVLVEWWQNAPELLPSRRFEIEIEGAGDEPRRLELLERA
jgi:tRNA threonylcarbamoyl adenosine modification protein YjeE